MKVKNVKYVLKRIGLELLFPILISLAILLYFVLGFRGPFTLIGIFAYLVVQSLLDYWPKLTFDTLFFLIKTDRFKIIKYPSRLLTVPDYKLYVVRVSDNKVFEFPATEVTGCLPNDIVSVKYYRLSKIILSCKHAEKAESDLKTIQ